jgi:hypothetical protein
LSGPISDPSAAYAMFDSYLRFSVGAGAFLGALLALTSRPWASLACALITLGAFLSGGGLVSDRHPSLEAALLGPMWAAGLVFLVAVVSLPVLWLTRRLMQRRRASGY